jgi:hypothetical protein
VEIGVTVQGASYQELWKQTIPSVQIKQNPSGESAAFTGSYSLDWGFVD